MPTSKKRNRIPFVIASVCVLFVVLTLAKSSVSTISNLVRQQTPTPTVEILDPEPTPIAATYMSREDGIIFAFPYKWTETDKDTPTAMQATFSSCDQVALEFKEVVNTKQTAAQYLNVAVNKLEKTDIENHTAYTLTIPEKSTQVIITDPNNNRMYDLTFTPTCNQTLDQAIANEFFPILSSLRFVSPEGI